MTLWRTHRRLPAGSRATLRTLLLLSVLVSLASTGFGAAVGLRPASVSAAAQDCLGSATRKIRYTSDGVLHLEGCGQVFTLSDVAAAPAAAAPNGSRRLELVDPAAKIWFLKVNLKVEEGATLTVRGGTGGDATWLRLRSDTSSAIWLRTENGTLRFQDTKVTSWNAAANTVDTDYTTGGRAFIAARSVWTAGRETAPPTACTVHGTDGAQEPYEARMDVINSEIAYLGHYAAESYGMVWKVYSKTPPPDRQLYTMVDVFGTVTDSHFHHNYFGAYTYGAYCMDWTNNTFAHNVEYGLDPHDDSDYLLIQDNTFHDNGNHGVICSVACNNLVIRNNVAYNNRHGIMIHRNVDGALIEGNTSYDNREAGIAIFDSHAAVVRNNIVRNNGTAAVRLSVGASRNVIENNTLIGRSASASGSGYVVYTYKGSDAPTAGDGRPKHNIFRNNRMTGAKSPLLKIGEASDTRFEGNTVSGSSSSATGLYFYLGSGNVMARTIFGSSLATHINTLGSSSFAASTIVRESEVGTTIIVQLDNYSTTTLEDSRGSIWMLPESGLSTTATAAGSSLALTATRVGNREPVTTRDFRVRPANGTITVQPTTWQTSAPHGKAWTESSSTTSGLVAHEVGNLQPGQCYTVTANSTALGRFTADSNGRISFAYGGYSGTIAFNVAPSTTGCVVMTAPIDAVATGPEPEAPQPERVVVDTTPPETSIVGAPPEIVDTDQATFAFLADEAGSTFACKLDDGAWLPCASGIAYRGMPRGYHTFQVRATDPAGNTDPYPESRSWTVGPADLETSPDLRPHVYLPLIGR